MHRNPSSITEEPEVLSRRDYQEILLARMAAGDLRANEDRLRIRRVDQLLDQLRIACGEKPLYASHQPPKIGQ